MRGRSWFTRARTCLLTIAGGLLVAAVPACSGTLGDPYGTGPDGKTPGEEEVPGPDAVAAHLRFPRLSHAQWERTIVDLFRLDTPTGLSSSFTPDPLGGKAFDNNESSLQVTPNLWADYQRAAEEVALLVTSNPALLEKIAPADLPQDAAAKKKAFLESFGRRAFRRPMSAAEVTRFTSLFDEGAVLDPTADPFVAGVRLTIEAFLQSPFFVYRPELSILLRPDGKIQLSGHEVATRLSYALWGTMPDDQLFAAADAGKLVSLAGIEAEARRLLAHERSRDTLVAFHDQLYDADQYVGIDKAVEVYPDFDPAVGDDMRKELSLFIDHVIFTQKGTLADLLTTRTTFVNARLASVYGLDTAGLDNDNFVQIELPEAERAGLLTRSGFLAWKGTKTQPDTILRGVFVNRRILCQDLGDPPDAAMGAMLGDELTNRDKVTALTGKGTCGESCHGTFINPAGFAFESYGAMGEFRTMDNGFPINAADSFPFEGGAKSYDGAVEFSNLAAEVDQTHRCYTRYWLEFLYGRDKKPEDAGVIADIAALSKGGSTVEDLVVALVTSDAFLTRPVEEVQ
jgi:hypothetical protein